MLFLASLGDAATLKPRPVAKCLSVSEARLAIRTQKLARSFPVMRHAAAQYGGEALGGKLCHRGDRFFYVITLLRHDGRILRVIADAHDGDFDKRIPKVHVKHKVVLKPEHDPIKPK
ncbi:MAG: hypothetical protein KGQ37_01405 [Hyphomicrobiales bacterium]|nr:hypothetical protein [Hyphomicrobiales bacterium]